MSATGIPALLQPIQERLDRRDHLVESGEYRRAVTRCDDTESVAALSHPHPSRVRTERQYAPTYVGHLEALADKVPSLLAAVQAVTALHPREVLATHEGYGEEAWCPYCCDHWPCETVSAVVSALGGEA